MFSDSAVLDNNDKVIRPCGSGYSYCNGNCVECNNSAYEYSNSTTCREFTDASCITKPTKEQYEASKEARNSLYGYIKLSAERQEQLLDELFKERCTEKSYRHMYEQHQNLIRIYETYEELANHENC